MLSTEGRRNKYYVFGVIKMQAVLFYAVDISFIFCVQQKLHADVIVGFEFILDTRGAYHLQKPSGWKFQT